ncbi:(2Fe-2S)-binding protein [Fulvimarina endophytica]|uniref:(2Fe-2S)-binding protein n=1 Tax=Fulvimarina endophytica TaxID=2293836 RepID=A0A371X4P3_9HYPH|nr:(2Fe-2S)-binding protein [Fulvimarina endophytica]RFC64190.1 (2Fe-2S)-binding protein [Fulvimarina endophytica]
MAETWAAHAGGYGRGETPVAGPEAREAPWTLGEALAAARLDWPALPVSLGAPGEGWRDVAALFEDEDAITAWLAFRARSYPGTDLKAAAAFVLADYAYLLTMVTAPLFVGFGLVPDLIPGNVHLRYAGLGGESGERGVESDANPGAELRFASEAAFAEPAVPVVSPSLCDHYRRAVEAHVAPLVETLSGRSRLARSAFWRLVADAVAFAFLDAGERVGRIDYATECALAVVKQAGSPLSNRQTGFVDLLPEGEAGAMACPRRFRVRGGCCRYYTVTGGSYCAPCVLKRPADRDRDLRSLI